MILRHMTGTQLRSCHTTLTHEVLQVHLRDHRRGPTRLRHESEGKERRHPIGSTTVIEPPQGGVR
jgi:hypothetical protein